jgi:hypothetical protein
MTTDKAMTPEAPMDSPPMSAPMTPEEVREARRTEIIARINKRLEAHPGDAPWSCTECYHGRYCADRAILTAARDYFALKGHAEAMAEAIGSAKAMDVPRDIAMAFAEYRTQFPRNEDGR